MNTTLKAIVHGAVSVALFALPLILSSNNPDLTLTIGGILNAIYHALLGYAAPVQG